MGEFPSANGFAWLNGSTCENLAKQAIAHHNIIPDAAELVDCTLKISVDLLHTRGQRLPLGAADLELAQLAKLHHSICKVKNVVAAFEECVETHKEGVILYAPWVGGAL